MSVGTFLEYKWQKLLSMRKKAKYQHKKIEDLPNYHGKYYTPTMIG